MSLLWTTKVIVAIKIDTKINLVADSESPIIILEYIDNGTVDVSPGIFPATIIVAPNSEKALAKPRIKPAKTPFNDKGKVIVKKILILLAPKPRAHCSKFGSTDWKATVNDPTDKGKDTTAAASIVEIHVNAKLSLKIISMYLPVIEPEPRIQSKK